MIKAILFDLDGTLSLMNHEEFRHNYVGLLAPRFANLMSPERFAKQLWRSTEVMVREPKPGRTNLQTFFDDFTRATSLAFGVLWPIFQDFYDQDFPALRMLVKPNPDGKKAVDTAMQQGYAVAVAANPVMPKSAILERVSWAGLAPEQFVLVPALEEFHFCKPQPGFFAEMAERLQMRPEECLMVGNNPSEDLAGRELGMKTFLVGAASPPDVSDYSGGLEDLVTLLLKGNL